MEQREYYAIRRGFISKDSALDIEMFRKAFKLSFRKFDTEGYFQKYLGKDCVDGFVDGKFGNDIETVVFLRTGHSDLWPVYLNVDKYTDVDLFTIIEFLYDCASKPSDTFYHDYADCGVHVKDSNDADGKQDFRNAINPILKRFRNVELSEEGEILEKIESGFESLFNAPIPTENQEIITKINTAQIKFRRSKSTIDERKDALRELADILEHLRPKIKTVLMSKDENELFIIANNFGIRHFNSKQKDDYDKPIWHAWMYYCYLATIHACLRLVEKQKTF
jgi:hypothetical protein